MATPMDSGAGGQRWSALTTTAAAITSVVLLSRLVRVPPVPPSPSTDRERDSRHTSSRGARDKRRAAHDGESRVTSSTSAGAPRELWTNLLARATTELRRRVAAPHDPTSTPGEARSAADEEAAQQAASVARQGGKRQERLGSNTGAVSDDIVAALQQLQDGPFCFGGANVRALSRAELDERSSGPADGGRGAAPGESAAGGLADGAPSVSNGYCESLSPNMSARDVSVEGRSSAQTGHRGEAKHALSRTGSSAFGGTHRTLARRAVLVASDRGDWRTQESSLDESLYSDSLSTSSSTPSSSSASSSCASPSPPMSPQSYASREYSARTTGAVSGGGVGRAATGAYPGTTPTLSNAAALGYGGVYGGNGEYGSATHFPWGTSVRNDSPAPANSTADAVDDDRIEAFARWAGSSTASSTAAARFILRPQPEGTPAVPSTSLGSTTAMTSTSNMRWNGSFHTHASAFDTTVASVSEYAATTSHASPAAQATTPQSPVGSALEHWWRRNVHGRVHRLLRPWRRTSRSLARRWRHYILPVALHVYCAQVMPLVVACDALLSLLVEGPFPTGYRGAPQPPSMMQWQDPDVSDGEQEPSIDGAKGSEATGSAAGPADFTSMILEKVQHDADLHRQIERMMEPFRPTPGRVPSVVMVRAPPSFDASFDVRLLWKALKQDPCVSEDDLVDVVVMSEYDPDSCEAVVTPVTRNAPEKSVGGNSTLGGLTLANLFASPTQPEPMPSLRLSPPQFTSASAAAFDRAVRQSEASGLSARAPPQGEGAQRTSPLAPGASPTASPSTRGESADVEETHTLSFSVVSAHAFYTIVARCCFLQEKDNELYARLGHLAAQSDALHARRLQREQRALRSSVRGSVGSMGLHSPKLPATAGSPLLTTETTPKLGATAISASSPLVERLLSPFTNVVVPTLSVSSPKAAGRLNGGAQSPLSLQPVAEDAREGGGGSSPRASAVATVRAFFRQLPAQVASTWRSSSGLLPSSTSSPYSNGLQLPPALSPAFFDLPSGMRGGGCGKAVPPSAGTSVGVAAAVGTVAAFAVPLCMTPTSATPTLKNLRPPPTATLAANLCAGAVEGWRLNSVASSIFPLPPPQTSPRMGPTKQSTAYTQGAARRVMLTVRASDLLADATGLFKNFMSTDAAGHTMVASHTREPRKTDVRDTSPLTQAFVTVRQRDGVADTGASDEERVTPVGDFIVSVAQTPKRKYGPPSQVDGPAPDAHVPVDGAADRERAAPRDDCTLTGRLPSACGDDAAAGANLLRHPDDTRTPTTPPTGAGATASSVPAPSTAVAAIAAAAAAAAAAAGGSATPAATPVSPTAGATPVTGAAGARVSPSWTPRLLPSPHGCDERLAVTCTLSPTDVDRGAVRPGPNSHVSPLLCFSRPQVPLSARSVPMAESTPLQLQQSLSRLSPPLVSAPRSVESLQRQRFALSFFRVSARTEGVLLELEEMLVRVRQHWSDAFAGVANEVRCMLLDGACSTDTGPSATATLAGDSKRDPPERAATQPVSDDAVDEQALTYKVEVFVPMMTKCMDRREEMRETLMEELDGTGFNICSIPLPDPRFYRHVPAAVPRYVAAHARGFTLERTYAEEILMQQRVLQSILITLEAQQRRRQERRERRRRRRREARERRRNRVRAGLVPRPLRNVWHTFKRLTCTPDVADDTAATGVDSTADVTAEGAHDATGVSWPDAGPPGSVPASGHPPRLSRAPESPHSSHIPASDRRTGAHANVADGGVREGVHSRQASCFSNCSKTGQPSALATLAQGGGDENGGGLASGVPPQKASSLSGGAGGAHAPRRASPQPFSRFGSSGPPSWTTDGEAGRTLPRQSSVNIDWPREPTFAPRGQDHVPSPPPPPPPRMAGSDVLTKAPPYIGGAAPPALQGASAGSDRGSPDTASSRSGLLVVGSSRGLKRSTQSFATLLADADVSEGDGGHADTRDTGALSHGLSRKESGRHREGFASAGSIDVPPTAPSAGLQSSELAEIPSTPLTVGPMGAMGDYPVGVATPELSPGLVPLRRTSVGGSTWVHTNVSTNANFSVATPSTLKEPGSAHSRGGHGGAGEAGPTCLPLRSPRSYTMSPPAAALGVTKRSGDAASVASGLASAAPALPASSAPVTTSSSGGGWAMDNGSFFSGAPLGPAGDNLLGLPCVCEHKTPSQAELGDHSSALISLVNPNTAPDSESPLATAAATIGVAGFAGSSARAMGSSSTSGVNGGHMGRALDSCSSSFDLAAPSNSMYGTYDAYYGHTIAAPQAVLLRQQVLREVQLAQQRDIARRRRSTVAANGSTSAPPAPHGALTIRLHPPQLLPFESQEGHGKLRAHRRMLMKKHSPSTHSQYGGGGFDSPAAASCTLTPTLHYPAYPPSKRGSERASHFQVVSPFPAPHHASQTSPFDSLSGPYAAATAPGHASRVGHGEPSSVRHTFSGNMLRRSAESSHSDMSFALSAIAGGAHPSAGAGYGGSITGYAAPAHGHHHSSVTLGELSGASIGFMGATVGSLMGEDGRDTSPLRGYNHNLLDLLGAGGGPMYSGITYFYTFGDRAAVLFNASLQPTPENAAAWESAEDPAAAQSTATATATTATAGSAIDPAAKEAAGTGRHGVGSAASSSHVLSPLKDSGAVARNAAVEDYLPVPKPLSKPIESAAAQGSDALARDGAPGRRTGSAAPADVDHKAPVMDEGCSYFYEAATEDGEEAKEEKRQAAARERRNMPFYSVFRHLHRTYFDTVLRPLPTSTPQTSFSPTSATKQAFTAENTAADRGRETSSAYRARAGSPAYRQPSARGSGSLNSGSSPSLFDGTPGHGGGLAARLTAALAWARGCLRRMLRRLTDPPAAEAGCAAEAAAATGDTSAAEETVTFGGRRRLRAELDLSNGHYGLTPLEVWLACRYSCKIASEVYVMDINAQKGDPHYPAVRVVDEVVAHAVLYYHNRSLRDFVEELEAQFGLHYEPRTRWGRHCLGYIDQPTSLPLSPTSEDEDGADETAESQRSLTGASATSSATPTSTKRTRRHLANLSGCPSQTAVRDRRGQGGRLPVRASHQASGASQNLPVHASNQTRALSSSSVAASRLSSAASSPSTAAVEPTHVRSRSRGGAPPSPSAVDAADALPSGARATPTTVPLDGSSAQKSAKPFHTPSTGIDSPLIDLRLTDSPMVDTTIPDEPWAHPHGSDARPQHASHHLHHCPSRDGVNATAVFDPVGPNRWRCPTSGSSCSTTCLQKSGDHDIRRERGPCHSTRGARHRGGRRRRTALDRMHHVVRTTMAYLDLVDQQEDDIVYLSVRSSLSDHAAKRLLPLTSVEEEHAERLLLRELKYVKEFLLGNRNVLSSASLTPAGSNRLEGVFGAPASVFPFLHCARESVGFVQTIFDELHRHYGSAMTYDAFAQYSRDVFARDHPEIIRHVPRIFRTLNKSRRGHITYEEICGWIGRKLSCGSTLNPDAHLLATAMSLRLPLALVLETKEMWMPAYECSLHSLSDGDEY